MSQPQEHQRRRVPRDIAFYGDLPPLKDSARLLLRQYSKIPDEDVDQHVENINVYKDVLERVKDGAKFLDLGCCFGQEIRQLVLDGAPAQNLVGSDLRSEFFEMGYELFKDKSTLPTKFIAADVFDPSSPLREWKGQFDIVYTGSFFHLFTYDEQVKVATLVDELLASKPGSMLIGRQVGKADPGAETIGTPDGGEMVPYRHNAESWKTFWHDFGQKTDTKWSVDVEVDENWTGFAGPERQSAMEAWSASMRMSFVVRRV